MHFRCLYLFWNEHKNVKTMNKQRTIDYFSGKEGVELIHRVHPDSRLLSHNFWSQSNQIWKFPRHFGNWIIVLELWSSTRSHFRLVSTQNTQIQIMQTWETQLTQHEVIPIETGVYLFYLVWSNNFRHSPEK